MSETDQEPTPPPSRVHKAQAVTTLVALLFGAVLIALTTVSVGVSIYRQFVPQVSYVCHQIPGDHTKTDGPCAGSDQ